MRIERSGRWAPLALREMWEYREVLFVLTWRDIKSSYNQAVLGIAWQVIKPFVTMVIFTVIFGNLAGLKGEYGIPYPLFVFSGLLPWTYFSSCLTQGSTSVVGESSLVKKVYFPRLLIPLSAVVSPLLDFLIAFVILLGMFAFYARVPSWHMVTGPFFLFLGLLTAFGAGLWLSALNVRYRDVTYLVPFLSQLWFFITPVIYGASAVPKRWQWLSGINPMTGVVDGFRWCVLGHGIPHYTLYATSLGIGIVLCISGIFYFRHVERLFADVI